MEEMHSFNHLRASDDDDQVSVNNCSSDLQRMRQRRRLRPHVLRRTSSSISKSVSWPRRVLSFSSTFTYLLLIVLTIPLAFDIGGQQCGLAYSLTLAVFNFFLSSLRMLGRRSVLKYLTNPIYHLQHIIIPVALIFFLNIFSDDSGDNKTCLDQFPANSSNIASTLMRVLCYSVEIWKTALQRATPVFTLLEGFCTLLVIQTIGQLSLYLVDNRSDSGMNGLILASSGIISASIYYLYRIYSFPDTIGSANASLIGVVLTCTVFVGAQGIRSGKGTAIESSLLFAYIVYCIYETFTNFQPSNTPSNNNTNNNTATMNSRPPVVPPVILESYLTLVSSLAKIVPVSFATIFRFIMAATATIRPSIAVSLVYRLSVLFTAMRLVIPRVRYYHTSPRIVSTSRPSSPFSPIDDIDTTTVTPLHLSRSSSAVAAGISSGTNNLQTSHGLGDITRRPRLTRQNLSSDGRSTNNRASSLNSSNNNNNKDVELGGGDSVVVLIYGPCIMIAVYTHLLMHHFGMLPANVSSPAMWSYFNNNNNNNNQQSSSSSQLIKNSGNVLLSWQLWNWINMVMVLMLYSFELVYNTTTATTSTTTPISSPTTRPRSSSFPSTPILHPTVYDPDGAGHLAKPPRPHEKRQDDDYDDDDDDE